MAQNKVLIQSSVYPDRQPSYSAWFRYIRYCLYLNKRLKASEARD